MQLVSRYLALSALFCVLIQPADSGPNKDNVLPPFGHTVFCLRYPADCERTSSQNATKVPAEVWRKMNSVNTSVNTAIASKADFNSVDTDWLIAPFAGDCADYAVTKRHQLLEAGWPSSSLLLAEVELIATGEHHLILIVRGTKADWVLDNPTPFIVKLAETRNDYVWHRIESADDPRRWTKSFAFGAG